ncbi:MAG TPA: methyltransferase domain-containing protein [Solirubrobacteraceae bacterium]|jgi:trans-aconitate 2-methyltransferase|nr:methyltransferase domain-containing protein [Solirubrobacteraceae bacterium]
MPVREWDGTSYDRVSGPLVVLGREVLARLELRGDELALDAGCGSGRITEALVERLPRGRVIAVDESPSMVRAAQRRLGADADVRVADLLELELDEPVDAILSTATFHWISDHEALFGRLRNALRPGGRLVAQCGGEGNIDVLRGSARALLGREPYAPYFAGWRAPWNYAGAEESRRRLLAAGFSSAECWLTPAPQQPEHTREFLQTVIFEPHMRALPRGLRERFLDELLEQLGEPVIVDYVRLNIDAVA